MSKNISVQSLTPAISSQNSQPVEAEAAQSNDLPEASLKVKAGVPVTPANIISLQTTIGNRAVNRLLARQAGEMTHRAGSKAVQRTIRVDDMDDGEPFEKVDFIASHFSSRLTSGEKKVYLEWLKDEVDHHYANKEELITAIKASVQPDTQAFVNLFTQAALTNQLNLAWLEQYLTDKGNTLLTLADETPKGLLEKVKMWNDGSTLTTQQLPATTLKNLLTEIMTAGVMTQSCGQSANLLHSFISPSTVNQVPQEIDTGLIKNHILDANSKTVKEHKHYYVKIEGGGHAFIVEVYNDKCKIYQSFFGRYSLAKDLERDKDYPINQFLPLLEKALTTSSVTDTVPREVEKSRQNLFNSNAIHPTGTFKVTSFAQEAGTAGRIQARLDTDKPGWDAELNKPASNFLKDENAVAPVEDDIPARTVMDFTFDIIASMMSDPTNTYDDEAVEAGNVPLNSILKLGNHSYKVTEKTATNYKVVWQKPQ